MQLSPGKLWGLRRMADENGIFKMVALDQRPPIEGPIAAGLGLDEAPWQEVARFKRLLIETLQDKCTAMLLDPHYAIPHGIDLLSPAKGLIVTLEDSVFRNSAGGRLSSNIDGWSVAKIKRMGGDAVKVLVWYQPAAGAAVNRAQRDYVKRIGDDCAHYDIPFLLEMLVYPLAADNRGTSGYVEMTNKKADDVLDSVREFAHPDYGVDVFKLESPVNAAAADGSTKVSEMFGEMGRLAGRPWVMLSAGTGKTEFLSILKHAFAAGASGFLAGRAIWQEAFAAYPDWDRIRHGLAGGAADYINEICTLADASAATWSRHARYGPDGARFAPADASFRYRYDEFPAT